jgi:hypothetical protein
MGGTMQQLCGGEGGNRGGRRTETNDGLRTMLGQSEDAHGI